MSQISKFISYSSRFLISGLIVCSIIFVSCGGYKNAEPLKFFGANPEHFKIASNGKYFVVEGDKIHFLDTASASSLTITEALPITESFSNLSGNQDTVFLQIGKEIAFYQLLTKNNNYWEKVASITGSNKCDVFAKVGKYLVIANGNQECATDSAKGLIKVYSLEKLNTPTLVATDLITNPKDIIVYKNTIFIAQGSYGLKAVQLSADGKMGLVKEYPNFKAEKLTMNSKRQILVVTSLNNITQYDVSNVQNIQVLSSVLTQN